MRVIAGSARGLTLSAPRGLAVRPTSDRLRGAIFSSLGARVVEARVWDACAGTGAVGIEALSRGAAAALFSEPSRAALAALRRNLRATKLEARAEVMASDWERALALCAKRGARFDVVYFDPPWAAAPVGRFCAAVGAILADDARVLIEHPIDTVVDCGTELEPVRQLRAAAAAVTFLAPVRARGCEARVGV